MILIADQFKEKMKEFYDKPGHPGRDAVIHRFKESYAEVPVQKMDRIVVGWEPLTGELKLRFWLSNFKK